MFSPFKSLVNKVLTTTKKEQIHYEDDEKNNASDDSGNEATDFDPKLKKDRMIDEANQFYDENGHDPHGNGHNETVVRLPSQLIHTDIDDVKELCSGLEIDINGNKFELIGRLLKEIDIFPKEDLNSFNDNQLQEMCNGLQISAGGTKEELIIRIYENVFDGINVIMKEKDSNNPEKDDKDTLMKDKRKRQEDDSEILKYLKKRKLDLPMSSEDFMIKAEKLTLEIENNTYEISPKEYPTTKSYGWYSTGRQTIEVDGVPLNVAWNINMTVLGR
jgi:hypothetical protein